MVPLSGALGGPGPIPWLPGSPRCLTREKPQLSPCGCVPRTKDGEQVLIHWRHRYRIHGKIGEEVLSHQRGDLASFDGTFPPVKLRRVQRMPTSWPLPAAALPLTCSSLMFLGCSNHGLQPGPWVSWQPATKGKLLTLGDVSKRT